jgi:hypothetical protein
MNKISYRREPSNFMLISSNSVKAFLVMQQALKLQNRLFVQLVLWELITEPLQGPNRKQILFKKFKSF